MRTEVPAETKAEAQTEDRNPGKTTAAGVKTVRAKAVETAAEITRAVRVKTAETVRITEAGSAAEFHGENYEYLYTKSVAFRRKMRFNISIIA